LITDQGTVGFDYHLNSLSTAFSSVSFVAYYSDLHLRISVEM